jgi:hypothetical protein
MIMALAPVRHAIREWSLNWGNAMTSLIGIAPGLMASGLALAAIAGPAVPSAMAGTGPSVIGTDLAGPPADPSMVFTGPASQPLAGSLPGSSAPIPVSYTVTNARMLPPGIAIGTAGAVTGIPAADGIYGVSVTACNMFGCTPGTVTFAVGPAAVALSLQTIGIGT